MGEINKIGANPFEVKIQQLNPERRFYKEPTIRDEENHKNNSQEQQAGARSSQHPHQENSPMNNLMETLRKRQEEENYNEYVNRKALLQRERNRQASEEYIRQVKEYREELAEKADQQLEETKEYNKAYTARLQDIGKQHVEKLLRHQGEQKLSERARQLKEAGQQEQADKELNLSLARAKLRPEVSHLLRSKQGADRTEQLTPNQGNRQLLDQAVNKLRLKLGGAHLNPHKGLPGEVGSILESGSGNAPTKPAQGEIFRPDLEQVKHSIEHARILKEEDPNRYIPLEASDIQQMLFEHKLPINPGMVQSLLLASQRLRDSSHIFMKAALLVATAGLYAETEMMRVITQALRTFEKYPRPSLVRKLLRYILNKKMAQAMAQNSQNTPIEPPVEMDDLILRQTYAVPNFKDGKGKLATGLPVQPEPLPTPPDRSKAPLYQAVERSALKILTPEEIAKAYEETVVQDPLQQQVETWLKRFGLPASKVMVHQLVQSAKGDALQAQALVLQLALGQSLNPDKLKDLVQKLRQLSPAARELPAQALLQELGLEVSAQLNERLKKQGLQETPLTPEQLQQWQTLLRGSLRSFRSVLEQASPSARLGLLLLYTLAQRTDTLNHLLPRLQQALRHHPQETVAQLAQLLASLQPFLQDNTLPRDRSLKAESKLLLSQTYAKILQPGANASVLSEIIPRLQWQRPLTLSAEVMTPEDWQLPADPAPPDISSPVTLSRESNDPLAPLLQTLPESTQQLLERMSLARQALQLMLELAQKTGIDATWMPRLSQRLSQPQVLALLQRLEHLTPLLQQVLAGLQPPAGQVLSPESQQQLLHVLQQQLDKGGQAYLLPRVMADLRWVAQQDASPAPLQPAWTPVALPQTDTAPLPPAAPASSQSPPVSQAFSDPQAWADHLLQHYTHLPAPAQQQIRESILLLATLAERTGILQNLIPSLSWLIHSQPQRTAVHLQSIQPALQQALDLYLAAGARPLPADRQQALSALLLERLQAPPSAPLPTEGLEQIWQRFYGAEVPLALSPLLNSPTAWQGFAALHHLVADFELSASWLHAMRSLWQNPPPGLEQRLSQLQSILSPAFEYLALYPQQLWLLSNPLQTRIAQALWQYLNTGQHKALQAALIRLMTENPHQRDPLPLVEERLRHWGLQTHPALSQQLWSLAQGSRDRLDALAFLYRHHLPLLPANTEAVLRYFKGIPPHSRFAHASDILRLLSPELITLSNAQQTPSLEPGTADPGFLARWLSLPLPGSKVQLQSLQTGAISVNLQHLETVIQQLAQYASSAQLVRLNQQLAQLHQLLQQGQGLLQQFSWPIPLQAHHLEPLQPFLTALKAFVLDMHTQWATVLPPLARQGPWLEGLSEQLHHIMLHLIQTQELPEVLHVPMRQLLRQLAHQLQAWQQIVHQCETLQQAPGIDCPELQHLTPWTTLQDELGALIKHLSQLPAGKEDAQRRIVDFLQRLYTLPNKPWELRQAYLDLEAQLQSLHQIPPGQSRWISRMPAQIIYLLQQVLTPQAWAEVLPQLQRLLPRLALALSQVPMTSASPASQHTAHTLAPVFLPAELSPEQEAALARLTEMPQNPEALQRYLQLLGLPPPSPEQLQHILALAQNSRERLDAIGILLRSQMPLLPAHIQIIADYVRLLPPSERFRSISQILLYLSDALLAQMKSELQQPTAQARLRDLTRPQGWQPDPEAEQTGESLLHALAEEPSESTLESLRYLLQSPLPKTPSYLEKLQRLQHLPLEPKALLQPIQETLGHLLALVQGIRLQNPTHQQAAMAYLQHLQEFFSQSQQLLMPTQQALLGPWLMGLTDQLQRLEQTFMAHLAQFAQKLGFQQEAATEGWLTQVIRQVNQLVEQLAAEIPEKREELDALRKRFQQAAGHLREELASLQLYTQIEPQLARNTSNPLPLQLIIPAFIQSLGYPVEILLQESPQREKGAKSQGGTQIQLNIKTHTLGTLLFSLEQRRSRLHIRLGVENVRIRDWLQPYLEALSQKLADFSWQVESLQTWIVPQGTASRNLIARQMYTRYRHSAIEAL